MRAAVCGGVVLLTILSGCTAVRPADVVWAEPGVSLVWPEPPETPRIRFLRTLDAGSFVRREDRAGRLFRWMTGENDQALPLVSPYGVVADGDGRVWVADGQLGVVHLFDLARQKTTYVTSAGKEPFTAPAGVAFDGGRDWLYVSDAVQRKVYVVGPEGELVGTREPPGGFGRPAGLATDAQGRLYVVDVPKGRVEVFSREGEHLKTMKSAVPGGRFNLPSNVAVDGSGRIFVTDSMNFRIEVFAPDGSPLGTIGQIGDVPGSFARPRGVAVDSQGHVYVADAAFDNIQIFDVAGRLLLYIGGPGSAPGMFNLPAGLFFDRHDRLYVADSYNHRIQIFQYLPSDDVAD